MKTILQTLFFFVLISQICFTQWYQQNSGTTNNLNEIRFHGTMGRVVGDLGTILGTWDEGITWTTIESGTTKNINGVIAVIEHNWMFVGDSGLIIIADSILPGIPSVKLNSVSGRGEYAQSCAVGENGIILISDGGGSNWVTIQNDKPYGLKSVNFIYDSTMWTVGDSGMVLKTTDRGENWSIQNIGVNTNFKCVQFINQDVGWIGGRGMRLKTTDGGTNWTATQTPGLTTTSVCFIDESNGWSVANANFGYSGMIEHTTDGGQSWMAQLTDVKPFWSILFVDENNGWAVGDSGSIYHTTNGGVTFIVDESTQPTDFILSQNFPNPFNPSTKIKYSVLKTSNVVIKVFDILGNELETLVNKEKQAGTYEITWYAENLPSGVYFYQLRATPIGEQAGVPSTSSGQVFVQTKKMILLK